jgi:hypothetical protein
MLQKPAAPLLIGRLLLGLALAAITIDQALAHGYGMDSSLPFLDDIIEWIGLRNLTGDWRNLFGYCLLGFALVFGYLTNLAFDDRGFGQILNGVVGIFGVCLALRYIGPYFDLVSDASGKLRLNIALIIAGSGAAVALCCGAFLKGVVMRFLRIGLDRLDRPARPKPFQIDAPTDARVGSAMREEA